jgi:hypothetical protein
VREANEVAEDGTIEGAVNILLGQLIRRASSCCGRGEKKKKRINQKASKK